jgi:LAS superfamily LD-carboxypeptidase LdcB
MNELELTGRARTHIVELDSPRCALHYAAATSFLAMRDAAAAAGIDLVPASSFRDFDRQLQIWNAKWRGERPLLDRDGRTLDAAALDDDRRIEAILC